MRAETIATRPAPRCLICGAEGALLYAGLRDVLFGAPGRWRLLACDECGLAWLDPQPRPDEIWKAYSGYHTHLPAARRRWESRRRSIARCVLKRDLGYDEVGDCPFAVSLARVLSRIPFVRECAAREVLFLGGELGGRILDVGCGNGAFLRRMLDLGWEGIGVETDEEAAETARREHGVEVVIGTLDSAGLPKESFDVITMDHVIEHVCDPVAHLRTCRDLLRAGGQLVMTTPNLVGLGHKLLRRNWRGIEAPRHFRIFSPRSLRLCAEKALFRTLVLRSSNTMARWLWYASRAIGLGKRQQDLSSAVSLRFKIEGCLFFAAGEAVRAFSQLMGEEVVFVGQRASDPGE